MSPGQKWRLAALSINVTGRHPRRMLCYMFITLIKRGATPRVQMQKDGKNEHPEHGLRLAGQLLYTGQGQLRERAADGVSNRMFSRHATSVP